MDMNRGGSRGDIDDFTMGIDDDDDNGNGGDVSTSTMGNILMSTCHDGD